MIDFSTDAAYTELTKLVEKHAEDLVAEIPQEMRPLVGPGCSLIFRKKMRELCGDELENKITGSLGGLR